jgi:hypothetical protein
MVVAIEHHVVFASRDVQILRSWALMGHGVRDNWLVDSLYPLVI